MAETCKKCKKGKINPDDRASEHNSRKVCDNCSAYYENGKFMGYLEKVDADNMTFGDDEDIEREQSQAD